MHETQLWTLGWEDPLEQEMQPTLVFLPGTFHGQRCPVGYSPWNRKQLDITVWLTHTHGDRSSWKLARMGRRGGLEPASEGRLRAALWKRNPKFRVPLSSTHCLVSPRATLHLLFCALSTYLQVLIEQTLAGAQWTQIIVCLSKAHVNWRVVESTGWVTREKPITPCTYLKGSRSWKPDWH